MMHELKVLETYFQQIKKGNKTFEIRNNADRGFQKGDKVWFRETNGSNDNCYTGAYLMAKITYVTNLIICSKKITLFLVLS